MNLPKEFARRCNRGTREDRLLRRAIARAGLPAKDKYRPNIVQGADGKPYDENYPYCVGKHPETGQKVFVNNLPKEWR